ERVAHLARVAEAMGEGEARARLRAPLHALVTRLVGALDDRPPPPRGVEVRPPGPDEVAEVPPEGATIAGLWAEGEGVVLALPDALLRIGPSGRVQARLAYAGEVLHVGRGHALILGWGDEDEGLPLRLLALEEGRWRAGRVELDAVFGGPVLPPTWTLAMGGDIGPGPRTPDGACWVDPEGQVVRLVDEVVVPEDALPPLWDEEWDDERDEAGGADEAAEEPPGARARPPLLPVLSGRRVHVDGVTFELGGAEEAPVGEELARAAVDLGDRWRTCFGAWLGEGPERVAWLGAPATHAAFSEDGRTLWIVAAGHLHEIEWHASPRWRRAFSLAGLAEPATERLREVAP
ncbi:MAG TPA: hypothetical protein RMG95_01290, partial [Polyangiaceae bacterium LLY-WYZ-15_(1-7)]|nr:hypothetical protein [Polyangiaceae bacterium LLY-WYZ-15_(1-7)]